MKGGPKVGNIEPSGQRLWILWQKGASADVADGGEKGNRPLTAYVPDSWTSEQVAQYIIQQAQPGGKFAEEWSFAQQRMESALGFDAWNSGKNLQNKNIGLGLVEAGESIKQYLEFIGSINPGGNFIFSLQHAFDGQYLAAIVGMATLLPWEKFAALLNKIPTEGMTFSFANGEAATVSRSALEAFRGMDDAQKTIWREKILNAKSADAAQKVFDELASIAPIGIPNATRLTPAEQATAARLQSKLGITLQESGHVGAEYVDHLGRYYDQLGNPKASKFWNEREFVQSIADHLLKSNEFTVIDMTGFAAAQIEAVRKYLDNLSPELQARVIRIGF